MKLTARQRRYIRNLKERALCGEFPKKLFITSVEECDNYIRSIDNLVKQQNEDSNNELLLLELRYKIESKRNFLQMDRLNNERLYYCNMEGWVSPRRDFI